MYLSILGALWRDGVVLHPIIYSSNSVRTLKDVSNLSVMIWLWWGYLSIVGMLHNFHEIQVETAANGLAVTPALNSLSESYSFFKHLQMLQH